MEDITHQEIDKLLTIIKPAPLIRIGHFSDKGDILPQKLSSFSQDNEYEYTLNCTSKEYLEKKKPIYEEIEQCSVKLFDLNRKSYMLQGKFYDYLFVSCDIEKSNRDLFFKKSHRVIKNAGLILIFVQNEQASQANEWIRLLEENYFVATSTIKLDEIWNVIISKKMHGWGG